MRDWSGPWIWAFQVQDQHISIHPLASQVLPYLGPVVTNFFPFQCTWRIWHTYTSITKPHSDPGSHRGKTGKSNKNLDDVGHGGEFDKATESAISSLFTPTSGLVWNKLVLYQTASCGPSASILSPPPPKPPSAENVGSRRHSTTDIIVFYFQTDHSFQLPTKNTLQLKPSISDPNLLSILFRLLSLRSVLSPPPTWILPPNPATTMLLQGQRPCLIHTCGHRITMPSARYTLSA